MVYGMVYGVWSWPVMSCNACFLLYSDPRSLGHSIPLLLVSFMASREAVALVANDPIISGTFIQSFRQFENQNPSSNSWDNFSVTFLAIRVVVVPLENNPIISGTSIWLFTHLEHQKVFKGWDNFLVSFLATREAVAPHANDPIMSGT